MVQMGSLVCVATELLIQQIKEKSRRPDLFEKSEAPYWSDPHISQQLLKAHLDEDVEAASRSQDEVRGTIQHLMREQLLDPGFDVLDLGCGPGLYAVEMVRTGARVTGTDLSAASLQYARDQAKERGLDITYIQQDFRDLDAVDSYDLVLQVYGELAGLDNRSRDQVLERIKNALRPGGSLVFDVSTPTLREEVGLSRTWRVSEGGFWRPEPYLVLEQGFGYPDDTWCDQYVVVDDSGAQVYRHWYHDYTIATLEPVLKKAGFEVTGVWGSLEGDIYTADSEWLAVSARPVA